MELGDLIVKELNPKTYVDRVNFREDRLKGMYYYILGKVESLAFGAMGGALIGAGVGLIGNSNLEKDVLIGAGLGGIMNNLYFDILFTYKAGKEVIEDIKDFSRMIKEESKKIVDWYHKKDKTHTPFDTKKHYDPIE